MTPSFKKRALLAPAKVNLALHIIKRRHDNFHKLDSLVTFADIGDLITLEPAENFSFQISGDFSGHFSDADRCESPESGNLAVRAAHSLAQIVQKPLNIKITLTKNIPLAAGLGGGSADAAAVLSGLCDIWNVDKRSPFMPFLLQKLGADVPACMACAPCFMQGIGENITPAPLLPETAIVLVNPLKLCPTKDVFSVNAAFHPPLPPISQDILTPQDLCVYLKETTNTLQPAAIKIVPEIQNILTELSLLPGNLLARMSGSGATCFGLFDTFESAQEAAKAMRAENPDRWIKSGRINGITRY